jgi:hypothetical protein
MTAAKQVEKAQERRQKEEELQMLNQLNQDYLREVQASRMRKLKDMRSLSVEYEQSIRNREQQDRHSRHLEKDLERSTLAAPTWIRDVFTERDSHRKNM